MFREILTKVLHYVDGGLGCILIGSDGIPVEQVVVEGHEDSLESISVEFNEMVNRMRRVVSQMELGPILTLTVQLVRFVVSAVVINDEYMLLAILEPESDVERAKGMLKLIVPQIIAEM